MSAMKMMGIAGWVMVALGMVAACGVEVPSDGATERGQPFAQEVRRFEPREGGFEARAGGPRVTVMHGQIELGVAARAGSALKGQAGQAGLGSQGIDVDVVGPALQVATTAVQVGDRFLDLTVLSAAQVGADTVETRYAELSELVRVDGQGAEQSWRFDRAPGAQGQLVVEVTLGGAAYLGMTASGLQFAQPGGLKATYGHGTWVDATGTRWPVPARYGNGRILLVVPASVVTSSAYPAVLDPQIIVTPIGG